MLYTRTLAAGGTNEFFYLLKNLRLGEWHPREILRTAETAEQQRMSGDSVSQWSQACIDADAVIGAPPGPHGIEQSTRSGNANFRRGAPRGVHGLLSAKRLARANARRLSARRALTCSGPVFGSRQTKAEPAAVITVRGVTTYRAAQTGRGSWMRDLASKERWVCRVANWASSVPLVPGKAGKWDSESARNMGVCLRCLTCPT